MEIDQPHEEEDVPYQVDQLSLGEQRITYQANQPLEEKDVPYQAEQPLEEWVVLP